MVPRFDVSVHLRDRKGHTQRHREEGHVTTEAEIAVVLPQAKECQELPKAQEARRDPPLGPSVTFTLDSGFQICERIHFYCFKPVSLA